MKPQTVYHMYLFIIGIWETWIFDSEKTLFKPTSSPRVNWQATETASAAIFPPHGGGGCCAVITISTQQTGSLACPRNTLRQWITLSKCSYKCVILEDFEIVCPGQYFGSMDIFHSYSCFMRLCHNRMHFLAAVTLDLSRWQKSASPSSGSALTSVLLSLSE